MNKLIIPIIAVLILVTGIGAYFIFQKYAFPQPPIGKCGDGICDEFEMKNSLIFSVLKEVMVIGEK